MSFAGDPSRNEVRHECDDPQADQLADPDPPGDDGDDGNEEVLREQLAVAEREGVQQQTMTTDDIKHVLAHLEEIASLSGRPLPHNVIQAFEDWKLYDDSEAWMEATTGTLEERKYKLADPDRRQGLKDNLPGIATASLGNVTVLSPRSPSTERCAAGNVSRQRWIDKGCSGIGGGSLHTMRTETPSLLITASRPDGGTVSTPPAPQYCRAAAR